MKKCFVYVCGKKRGGGRTAYRVGNLIYIKFDFCFTSFETFFLDFKKVLHNFQSFLCTKSRSQILLATCTCN